MRVDTAWRFSVSFFAMLRISLKEIDRMIQEAREKSPVQICGLFAGKVLGGTGGQAVREVREVLYMENISRNPIDFHMDPHEQAHALVEMKRKGLVHVGIFHSHTAQPAEPSTEDKQWANYPSVSYFILSLQGEKPAYRAFQISEGVAAEEKIEVTP